MEKEYKTNADSYITECQLGEGGASHVYKVKSSRDGVECALKLLKFKEKDAKKYLRFKNELDFLVNKPHENLVKIIDSGECDGFPFYIMPLAGGTLRDCIEKSNLSLDDKIKFVKNILDGLKFLHLNGVVHRDLKPENILIYDNVAKIADLGIAHFSDANEIAAIKTEKFDRLANFQYAAPEQRIQGMSDKLSAACDIYSFALIIHELFTGEYTSGNRSKKIGDMYPEYGYLDSVIEQSLCVDPKERIQSALDFSEKLKLAEYKIEYPPRDFRSVATHFKYDRFDKAFPDVGENATISDKNVIFRRLKELLRPPYYFSNRNEPTCRFDVLWWTRGMHNSQIDRVEFDDEQKIVYINGIECDIKRVVAFDSPLYYKPFVYVELNPKPFDSDKPCEEAELTYVGGKKISRSKADLGYYIDENGYSVKIDPDKCKTFIRHYKPWNFLILSSWHPFIKNSNLDIILDDTMDKILLGQEDVKKLHELSKLLPKPDFDLYNS